MHQTLVKRLLNKYLWLYSSKVSFALAIAAVHTECKPGAELVQRLKNEFLTEMLSAIGWSPSTKIPMVNEYMNTHCALDALVAMGYNGGVVPFT